MIDVTLENYNLVQKMLKGQPKKVNLVLSRAINRAATTAKAVMSKKVREVYLVPAAEVKKTIGITKATTSRPSAIVKSMGKRIGLAKFKTSPAAPRPANPPSAYKSQVKKSGGLKVVEGGFLANVNGGVGFFRRTGSSRLPIARLMGPSVPQMIGQKSVIEWVELQAKNMLNTRIQHELEQVLGVKP
jgi:hypothetical protein